MKQFFKIYRQLVITNVSKTLVHRVDTFNSIFSSLLWGVFSIVAVFLLTAKSTTVMGWTQGEILLLAATYAIIVGIFHICFSRNFPIAARIIHYGELDGLLLKPVHSLFLLIAREINIAHFVRFLLSIGLLFYILIRFDLPFSAGTLLIFFFLTIAGVCMVTAIHILFTTVLLYQSSLSNIMDFGSILTASARYPIDSLRVAPPIAALFFLPMMAAVNIPTKALIGKATELEIVLFLCGAAGLLFFSLWLWEKSLSRYTGASG